MAQLYGIKQVTQQEYNSTAAAARKGYLFLVRDFSGTTVTHSAIYFGNRKYADDDSKLLNLITSLGDAVDSNGKFIGFDAPTISGATSFTDAIEKLENALEEGGESIDEIKESLGDTTALSGKTVTELIANMAFIKGGDV